VWAMSAICESGLLDGVKEYRDKISHDAQLLRRVLNLAIDGLLITTPRLEDNPIVYASTGFLRLTGYLEHEVLGKNCRFLQGEETTQSIVRTMHQAVHLGESFAGTVKNYKKNGEPFLNYIRIEPIFDEAGEVEYFIGSQLDCKRITS
jgi:PAS domain S-box-containing protein